MTREARLHEFLRDQGLPVVSVNQQAVQLESSATAQQIQEAQSLHAGWDWTERRPKSIQDLIGAQDQMGLLWSAFAKRLLARLLQLHPTLDLDAGGTLEGDEPDE